MCRQMEQRGKEDSHGCLWDQTTSSQVFAGSKRLAACVTGLESLLCSHIAESLSFMVNNTAGGLLSVPLLLLQGQVHVGVS